MFSIINACSISRRMVKNPFSVNIQYIINTFPIIYYKLNFLLIYCDSTSGNPIKGRFPGQVGR